MPTPTMLWAQRMDRLYLTIDVQDIKDQDVQLTNSEESKTGKLTFSGKGGLDGVTQYSFEVEFNGEIEAGESKVSVSARNIFLIVEKKELGHWPRLTKDSGRHLSFIKCDWDKWVDEDEEAEGGQDKFDPSGMDFSKFGGPGGGGEDDGPGGFDPSMMGGMGGGGAGGFDMAQMMKNMGGGGAGGFDMSKMMGGMGGGMGGMGGMGGGGDEGEEDEEDSDNEDLPDLVK